MAIPLYQSSIDRALASGKTPEQLRTAMQNNKPMAPTLKAKALAYLDSKNTVKLPDATTGPYTKANADAAANQPTNIVPNSITNPSQPNDYSL